MIFKANPSHVKEAERQAFWSFQLNHTQIRKHILLSNGVIRETRYVEQYFDDGKYQILM